MRNFSHLVRLNEAGEDYVSDLRERLNAEEITEREFYQKLAEWQRLFEGRVAEVMAERGVTVESNIN